MTNLINRRIGSYIITAVFTIILFLFFFHLVSHDNKYTNEQPAGYMGQFQFSCEDFESPMFLIDGWMISVDGHKETETFIGEYSDFSYAPGGTSPFGKATYRLTLDCNDLPENGKILSILIPEIFTDYRLYINDQLVSETGDSHIVNFNMTGSTTLKLVTENKSHYYSGLYYPPAFGTSETIDKIHISRLFIYTAVWLSGIIVAILALVFYIWKRREKIFAHFAFMCISGIVCCIHPLIWQINLSSPFFYAVENMAKPLMIAEAIAVTVLAGGLSHLKYIKVIYSCLICYALFEFTAVLFIIPSHPEFISLHGYIVQATGLLCWLLLSVIAGAGFANTKNFQSILILLGSCTIGLSVLWNILDNNLFEPIYTMWQSEWAVFINILIFSAVIIIHNGKIVEENKLLNNHLEFLVEKRSEELTTVINERKRFFSDMAHNLKSPIATIHGFISLIQQHNIGLDDELCGYISIIKNENLEMQKRVQALNELNSFDRIEEPPELISINRLLDQVKESNAAGAEVNGIYLTIYRLSEDSYICAQKEKLLIMFENLIFNALSFTPAEGRITITPELTENQVVFSVKDNGSGIDPEILPYIFDRFYSRRGPEEGGSGLGLYIVKLTVEELNGKITCDSEPGKGTEFVITIPLSDS